MEELRTEITNYLYPGYVIAVIFATTWIRWVITDIDKIVHPKWVTLIVATILGLVGFVFNLYPGEHFDAFKCVISFGVATLGYDYIVKVVKDKLFPKTDKSTDEKQG